jgi:RNA polymerase sigma factor (sigma-70 family)
MQSMRKRSDDGIPTRRSLLLRLKNWGDQESWQRFFDTYGELIRRLAIKSGLTETEAQDVMQETLLAVAKNIGRFQYDPLRGSFKGWLLTVTRRRIADQFRKRPPAGQARAHKSTDTRKTATIDRVADPAEMDLEAMWDAEWQNNLLATALQRVKRRVRARQFQIFNMLVTRNWPAPKVACTLGVSLGQVYLVKHRLGGMLRKEIQQLKLRPM